MNIWQRRVGETVYVVTYYERNMSELIDDLGQLATKGEILAESTFFIYLVRVD